jgi:hypothetical protein
VNVKAAAAAAAAAVVGGEDTARMNRRKPVKRSQWKPPNGRSPRDRLLRRLGTLREKLPPKNLGKAHAVVAVVVAAVALPSR